MTHDWQWALVGLILGVRFGMMLGAVMMEKFK